MPPLERPEYTDEDTERAGVSNNLARLKKRANNLQRGREAYTQRLIDSVPATRQDREAVRKTDISRLHFERLTPTGESLMKASNWFKEDQERHPILIDQSMCAHNLSRVFSAAGLDTYRHGSVVGFMQDMKAQGAVMAKMPNDKDNFVAQLNLVFGDGIPAGTVVGGFHKDRVGRGLQHIGIVGHTDKNGVVWIYHQNWLRPDYYGMPHEHQDYMISKDYLAKGRIREWMASPWMKLIRDENGTIIDAESALPENVDMDPLGKERSITLAVPREIINELGGDLKRPQFTAQR